MNYFVSNFSNKFYIEKGEVLRNSLMFMDSI